MTLWNSLPGITPREAVADTFYRCVGGLDNNDRSLFDSAFTEGRKASTWITSTVRVTVSNVNLSNILAFTTDREHVFRQRTTLPFVNTLEQLDIRGNLATRAPDCIHESTPALHGVKHRKTNETRPSLITPIQESRIYFKDDYKKIWVNEGNVVTVYMSTTAAFPGEVKGNDESIDWTFYGEYIFVFELNETGDKIKYSLEFLDRKNAENVLTLMQRARDNLAAKKE